MGTRVMRVVDRMVIDLSGLATSGAAKIFLARRIDLAPYKQVTMYVRAHPGTSVAQTPTVAEFVLNSDGYTDEDPGALDSNNYPAFQLMLDTPLSVTTNFVAGQMKTKTYSSGLALASLQFNVTALAAATPLRYVISVDLTCKEY